MKKVIVSLCIVLSTVAFVKAQDFKPASGLSVEVNFIPANTATPISINELKGKLFLNDKMAIRLGLLVDMQNHTFSRQYGVGTPTLIVEEKKNKYFAFGLTPGIEIHVGDMPRLSPYFGAEILFRMNSRSGSITNYNGNSGDNYDISGCDLNGNTGSTVFGVNFLTGFDFYISKHLFMGAEIGFGFNSVSYKDVEVTTKIGNVTTTTTDPLGDSYTNLGIYCNPAIRLGWSF